MSRLVNSLIHSYSDTIANQKIAILGPYPPPLGGVSDLDRTGSKEP